MIVVQKDVWRAECIAAIGWDVDRVVQVFPTNCADFVEFEYETRDEAVRAYNAILEAWKRELGAGSAV